MSEHRPKTAALLAHAEGLLSEDGERRILDHLAGCAICRQELVAIQAYEQVLEEAREAPMPEVRFDRMELALAREAKVVAEGVRPGRAPSLGVFVLAGAAAAAALFVVAVQQEVPEPTRRPRVAVYDPLPVPPAIEEAAALEAVVTLVAGDSHRAGESTPLAPGDRLVEGESVITGEQGLLHLQLREGSGLIVAAASEIELSRAREDGVELTLAEGQVRSAVSGFSRTNRYIVLAGGYRVSAVGTQFTVAWSEELLTVGVSEGTVEVETPDGETLELTAPAMWRSDGAASEGEPRAVTVRRLAASETRALTLRHPSLVRWSVDGTEIESGATVQLRVAPGEHEVSGWDLRGRHFSGLVRVGDAAVLLDEGSLSPEAPQIRPGHLEEADIARVLGRGSRQLQRCYELALRRGTHAVGSIRLRLEVDVTGGVRRARISGLPDGSADLSQCISNYAQRWTFPPPGGPVTLDVPLQLAQTQ